MSSTFLIANQKKTNFSMVLVLTITLSISSALYAAGAAGAESGLEEIEEVVVTGIRGSLQDARNAKRLADAISDVISAEDVGKLPDENVAEALQRITGVTITRKRGEGQFVSVRGLPPEFTSVTVNGKSVPSTGVGRNFSFDVVASESLRKLTVYKSPMASIDEGGLGGTIDLTTPRPLDLGDRVLVGSAKAIYTEHADEVKPKISFLASDRFNDGTLGLLLGINYSERAVREDSVGFNFLTADRDGDKIVDLFYPIHYRQDLFLEDRDRFNVNGAIQYQPTDTSNFYLEASLNKYDTGQVAPTLVAQRVRPPFLEGFVVDDDGTVLFAADEPGLPVSLPGGSGQAPRLQFPIFYRELDETLLYVNGGADFDVGPWTISPSFSYAEGEAENDVLRFVPRVNNVSATYDLRNDPYFPEVTTSVDFSNPSSIPLTLASSNIPENAGNGGDILDDDLSFQIDVSREFVDNPILSSVEFGVKYRDREKSSAESRLSIAISGTADCCVEGGFPGGEFFNGRTAFPTWPIIDRDAAVQAFNLPSSSEIARSRVVDNKASFVVGEETIAGYIQLNGESTVLGVPVRGNVGIRVVDTKQSSSGTNEAGPVTIKRSYTDVLPSFNASFELSDSLLARLAVGEVMTRPAFRDLSPRESVNATAAQPNIQSGNPLLDPFRATQYDVSIERYFGENGLINIAVFHKDIKSFIFTESRFLEKTVDLGANGGILTDDFLVSAPFNGESGSVTGFEIGYQQSLADFGIEGPLSNLGYVLNYTYSESDVSFPSDLGLPDNLSLEGLSENSYNIIGYYEDSRFSIRLAYNWRDDFLSRASAAGQQLYADTFGQLDASISYSLMDRVTLFLEGVNLTDEKMRMFHNVPTRPRFTSITGRRFIAGFKFDLY